MKNVTITTDGSCEPNPGPGGWAAILRFGTDKKEIFGRVPSTTNNRMELKAIVEGLKLLKEPCQVLIRSDSQIAMSWAKNADRWPRSAAESHPDTAAIIADFVSFSQGHVIQWKKVEGHAGDPDNERCDALAAGRR